MRIALLVPDEGRRLLGTRFAPRRDFVLPPAPKEEGTRARFAASNLSTPNIWVGCNVGRGAVRSIGYIVALRVRFGAAGLRALCRVLHRLHHHGVRRVTFQGIRLS